MYTSRAKHVMVGRNKKLTDMRRRWIGFISTKGVESCTIICYRTFNAGRNPLLSFNVYLAVYTWNVKLMQEGNDFRILQFPSIFVIIKTPNLKEKRGVGYIAMRIIIENIKKTDGEIVCVSGARM